MIRARKIFDYRACSCTSRAPVLPGLKSRRLLIRFGGPVRSCVPPHGVEIPIRHVETSSVPLFSALRRVIWILVYLAFSILSAFGGNTTNTPSRLIESAGQVEFVSSGGTNWQPAAVGLALKPGDRIRTLERSRAAVQLSDRSVIRLDQRTTLEILPPQRSERKRFGLPGGAVYFFNREKPADVEFDTPLAAGAIRGTEFLLEVADANAAVHLALIDGLVSLQTTNGEINIQRGDDLLLTPGRPPQKTSLVNAAAKIQWALYYPAVVDPDELQLDVAERKELEEVLKTYRSGDML
ncbi:MAG TPA: FecR family protein, partial [Candidatus Paceibacterota bacterium]|nr:FecR family protein [Candidatus Paceibacterota bacterium]